MSKTNPADKLADFLKKRRIIAELTQMDVAEHLGYSSAQFISNWERGLSSPPVNTLKKLSHLYNIRTEEIFDIVLEVSMEQVKMDLQTKFFGSGKRLKSAR